MRHAWGDNGAAYDAVSRRRRNWPAGRGPPRCCHATCRVVISLSGGALRETAWLTYVRDMRTHFAQHERTVERMRVLLGDPAREPSFLSDADADTWQELLEEAEIAARNHRLALKGYLVTRPH